MCGIATETARYVAELKGTSTELLDTRKTAPGMRVLDKLAVKHGGGTNHRMGLYDMAMIKDNHIKMAGGIAKAVEQVRSTIDPSIKIEVETTNLSEVNQAIEAGADILTFHLEACDQPGELLEFIRSNGVMAAISVKPASPIESVYPYLESCDMVLVMTVEPGFGGQNLIPETLEKVRKLKAEIEKRNLFVEIQVDGGICRENVAKAISAGASIVVAGSAVFGAEDRAAAIEALRKGE
jgi:ribulose-phosphate 3-epimerase